MISVCIGLYFVPGFALAIYCTLVGLFMTRCGRAADPAFLYHPLFWVAFFSIAWTWPFLVLAWLGRTLADVFKHRPPLYFD